MYELQVLITPSSVPCSSSGDPNQNPAPVSLQISVLNISSLPLDLSRSALRFEFIVDPGGSSSAAALILSDNSVNPGAAPPTPVQNVQAAAVSGTAWSITTTGDGSPCAFLAVPQPTAGAGMMAPHAGISFVFSNVLVDLVPGASAVVVTVLPTPPTGSYTTTGPAYIAKTPPGLGITSFTAAPILLNPGGSSDLTWSTTGAAACELSWFPPTGVTVTYNDAPLISPATNLPIQVNGAQPVTAIVNAQTQFTLSAEGDGVNLPQSLLVDIAQPALYLVASTLQVMPNEVFTLYWSAFNTSSLPRLTWLTPGVQMTDNTTNQPIVAGQELAAPEGSANVRILQPTEFTLEVSNKAQSLTIDVFTVGLISVMASPNQFSGPGPNSSLLVTAVNATGFRITGPSGPQEYDLANPVGGAPPTTWNYQVVDTTTSFVYRVEALGYPGPGAPANPSMTAVARAKVALTRFTASELSIYTGSSTTLLWSAYAATGFAITGNGTTVASWSWPAVSSWPVTPSTTTTYVITAAGDTLGGPAPTLSLTVNVMKHKDKDKEKERYPKETSREKTQPKEKGPRVLEEATHNVYRDRLAAATGGTQKAFLERAQRPEPVDPHDDPEAG